MSRKILLEVTPENSVEMTTLKRPSASPDQSTVQRSPVKITTRSSSLEATTMVVSLLLNRELSRKFFCLVDSPEMLSSTVLVRLPGMV